MCEFFKITFIHCDVKSKRIFSLVLFIVLITLNVVVVWPSILLLSHRYVRMSKVNYKKLFTVVWHNFKRQIGCKNICIFQTLFSTHWKCKIMQKEEEKTHEWSLPVDLSQKSWHFALLRHIYICICLSKKCILKLAVTLFSDIRTYKSSLNCFLEVFCFGVWMKIKRWTLSSCRPLLSLPTEKLKICALIISSSSQLFVSRAVCV